MAAAIGERTEFMVHANSTAPGKFCTARDWPARPGPEIRPRSPATPHPFQCRAQMSVNSLRAVSPSTVILPLSRSDRT